MSEKCLWFPLDNGKLLLFGPHKEFESVPNLGEAYGAEAAERLKKKRDDLCVFVGEQMPVPAAGMLHRVGEYNGMPCIAYAAASNPESRDSDGRFTVLPQGLAGVAVSLRSVHAVIGVELYGIAGRGEQLLFWDKRSQYCSMCGAKTELAALFCKRCPACGNEMYPTVTPAVLAMVQREDRILLVRGREFTRPFFSLVAGFVEPGESLEECVRREVREETGFTVGNIRYFSSQPWPFPSNLMIGFTAVWKAGELSLQEDELLDGAFYTREELPALPHNFSLARRMIDGWVRGEFG